MDAGLSWRLYKTVIIPLSPLVSVYVVKTCKRINSGPFSHHDKSQWPMTLWLWNCCLWLLTFSRITGGSEGHLSCVVQALCCEHNSGRFTPQLIQLFLGSRWNELLQTHSGARQHAKTSSTHLTQRTLTERWLWVGAWWALCLFENQAAAIWVPLWQNEWLL